MTAAVRRSLVWAVLAAAALALSPAAALGAPAPPYEVTFHSVMLNSFAGIQNGPIGTETTSIYVNVPLTAVTPEGYSGSGPATYALATGTLEETCEVAGKPGTTKEIEKSGHPTTFTVLYSPHSLGGGGIVRLDLGPFTGGLEESFEEIPGCGGFTVGSSTPRFLADFTANHSLELLPFIHPGDDTFTFPVAPDGTLHADYKYSREHREIGEGPHNFSFSEFTRIDVYEHVKSACKVPNVKGESLRRAKAKIRHAGCQVGAVKHHKGAARERGERNGRVGAHRETPGSSP